MVGGAARMRNFAIVAHVDHGKSTLCDRLMELGGAVRRADGDAPMLDTLMVERMRGITVKAQTCSIVHRDARSGERFLLNLIDTPGHVDFSWEVKRSLAAVQGAVLLVDATQGVQAQTIATCLAARDLGLRIVPVLNKIDMQHADPARCRRELAEVLDFDVDGADAPVEVSAKTGAGVADRLLPALVERLPPPGGDPAAPMRALIVDASYDNYRGVVCVVRVFDGELRRGDRVRMASTGEAHEVQEVGVLTPEARATAALRCGQVGYAVCNLRDMRRARVGDTLLPAAAAAADARPLAGAAPAKPMVWCVAARTRIRSRRSSFFGRRATPALRRALTFAARAAATTGRASSPRAPRSSSRSGRRSSAWR